MRLLEGTFMPQRIDPKFDILPAAQQQIWNALAAAPRLGFVLYGGTAIALHLGHRRSIDFDFSVRAARQEPDTRGVCVR